MVAQGMSLQRANELSRLSAIDISLNWMENALMPIDAMRKELAAKGAINAELGFEMLEATSMLSRLLAEARLNIRQQQKEVCSDGQIND